MEIPQKLVKFKFHFLFALSATFALYSLTLIAPRLLTILAYFWPLFVSTALFLFAVVVFGKTTVPGSDGSGDKHGEGLLDYVAGQPHQVFESYKSE